MLRAPGYNYYAQVKKLLIKNVCAHAHYMHATPTSTLYIIIYIAPRGSHYSIFYDGNRVQCMQVRIAIDSLLYYLRYSTTCERSISITSLSFHFALFPMAKRRSDDCASSSSSSGKHRKTGIDPK